MRRSTAATVGVSAPAAVVGEWGRGAACAAPELDPGLREVFSTDTWTPWDTDAVAVCRACPVRPACAAYAGSITATSGIWGGWRRTDRPAVAVRYQDVSGVSGE